MVLNMRRWMYLIITLLLGSLSYRGATLVDEGFTRGWTEGLRLAWALGLVFAGLVAAGAFVAFLFYRGDQDVARLVFRVVLIATLALCLFFVAAHSLQLLTGFSEDRTFLIGFGAFVGPCTWFKPWWYWEHPKARFLRDIIGDRATTVVYYAVSLALIAYGVVNSHPRV